MFKNRFFASWLFSSVGMFLLSYVWHGIILSDFSGLTFPKRLFFLLAAVVYLIIGYAVTKCFSIPYLANKYKKKPLHKGFWAGAICGFTIFLITTIVGVSFNTTYTFKHLLYDAVWQTIEQGIGGVIVALAHIFVYEPDID